jgi:hypothetical protein
MLWLYVALGGGGLVVATRYLRARLAADRADAEAFQQLRALADEDVAALDTELQSLVSRELDRDARLDYQRAREVHDAARTALDQLTTAPAIRTVVEAIAAGRYALVRARASSEGRPVPERRLPCFFDPRHGPSAADVVWTQPGGGSRKLPACAADVARLQTGEPPLIRYAQYAGLRVPYWQAGLAPYGLGYFGGEGAGARQNALAAFNESAGGGPGRVAFGGMKFGTGQGGGFGVKGDPDASGTGSHTAG